MRTMVTILVCAAVLASPLDAPADAGSTDVDALKQQMEQLQEQMRQLDRKIREIEAVPSPEPPATPPPSSWSPAQPITVLGAGASYLNLSFDTLVDAGTSTTSDIERIQLGDHDPSQRGFSLRNGEIALEGAVDPYFKAFANIVFELDNDAETSVELEEAYALTTSLPWNLQVKAGQYFAEFGRHNPMHPHTWAFVDQPLILGRLFGGDGLRNVGARVSWLPPTPFYTELLLGIFNGSGETAASFRNDHETFGRTPAGHGLGNLGDLLYVPRIVSSFDLGDTQTVVVGASGAFGSNDTGSDTDTQIYGTDLYWKWRPINARQGFPFLSWQTEALLRRYEAGADDTVDPALPAETFLDYGFYSQALWGFRFGWVAGLRGEYVTGDTSTFDAIDPEPRADRARLSPNLTWYPTEFSKLRLQYNYDHGDEIGDESSVWLQLEFMIGAHAAHKF